MLPNCARVICFSIIIAEKLLDYNIDFPITYWYSGFINRKDVIDMDRNVKTLVYLALLTALCTVATMAIPIPTPTGGYLNAGDIIVVLTALLAGPFYGGIVGGLGSALADLFAGYTIYAPGTFLAKGVAAFIIGLIFSAAKRKNAPAAVAASICGELVMAFGYFAYEGLALGFGLGAAVEIPGNLLQGAAGVIGGVLLYLSLIRVPEIRSFSEAAQSKRRKAR